MLHSKQKFQKLVKQMNALQENEKGQLKGGFQTVNQIQEPLERTLNGIGCTCNPPKEVKN